MSKNAFQVKPLAAYDGARYLSQYGRDTKPLADAAPVVVTEEKGQLTWFELLRVATMFCLVFTLTLAMAACFPQGEDDHNEQWISDGGSGDGGEDLDGGDIMGGVMVECTPGDVYCVDDLTLQTCTDDYWPENVDCNDWCQETYGATQGYAYSNGCNAEAAEPCQCAFDMIDGGAPACFPGDVYCIDGNTMQTCDENYSPVATDCNSYCQAQSPNGYGWSAGCDAGAEDPCQCQYDIVDGDVASCLPGDVFCSDANTAEVCGEDQWSWTTNDCATYCTETYGADHGSTGCDATTPDNFCGCTLFVTP